VVKKLVESASIEKPILTLTPNAEFTKKLFFTYENDNRPWLPKLSKKDRYIEPIWTSTLVGQAVAFSMALLIVISTVFFTLEKTNPRVAIETRSKLEHIYNIPKEFLIESAQIYAHATLKFADEVSTQLAAVSVPDSLGSSTMLTINNLFEAMRMSFRHLKQIALDKFFFSSTPPQLTYTIPATSLPPSQALTTPTPSINLGSLKSELKTELENYIRLQIDSILPRQGGTNSPIVVYTSAPALATADFESFRTNSVVPEIHYHVTNQSNSDAERNSINLSNITDGGTFTNASISNSTFSGSLVSASSLSFGNATGTSATTTNLFSTNATFTNLTGVTLGLTDFSFTNATGTAATSTSFFGGQITGNQLGIGGSATSTINSSGDLLVVGSTTLQNFTFQNATGTAATTTNLFSTTASSTNLFTQLFTLNGFTLSSTANGTIGGTNTGDVTLSGTPDYLTISGQTITRNKLDISDDTNATGGLGLTLTANDFACDTANSTTFGCLASADWTTFNNKLSSYDAWTHPAYGGSATTSLLTLSGGFLNTAASSTIVGNLLITGNSTTTNATTTTLSITTASTTNLIVSSAGGSTGCAQFSTAGLLSNTGTACGTGGGTFSWTPGTYGATIVNATSTALQLKGGLYASSTVRFGNAGISPFFYDGAVGNLGLGTTSPFSTLSVSGSTWLDSNIINFASTSASTLTLNYLASATSTIPNNKLYAWTIATSTTATPIFRIDTTSSGAGSVSATTSIRGGFVLDDGAFNYDSYAGIASVDSLSTGPMAFDDNAGILSWMDMPVSTTTADIVMSYSAQIGGTSILTVYSESKGTGGGIKNGRIGIGTTSPYALLSLATTTNQLIDLFAISTSTSGIVFKVDSYGRTYGDGAYASPAADYAEYFYTNSVDLKSGEVVCVDVLENNAVKRCERGADNNVMGIVSTKPAVIGNYIKAAEADPSHYTIIGMLGQVDAFVSTENGPINIGDSLTSASTTPGFAMRASGGDSTVGIALGPMASSTGKIKVLISRRNKSLVVEEVEALVVERVAGMKIEDKVSQMIQQSVDSLDLDPKITAFASTTLSLSSRLDDIESIFASTSTATSTPASTSSPQANSFAGNFFKNLFTRITAWFASAANGIGDFFANRVRTKELCVSDESGAETCITKAKLDALLGSVILSESEESIVEESVVEESVAPAPSELIELIESEDSSESERPEGSSEPERPVIEEPVVSDDSVGLPVGEAGTPTDNIEAEPASEPTPESVSTP